VHYRLPLRLKNLVHWLLRSFTVRIIQAILPFPDSGNAYRAVSGGSGVPEMNSGARGVDLKRYGPTGVTGERPRRPGVECNLSWVADTRPNLATVEPRAGRRTTVDFQAGGHTSASKCSSVDVTCAEG
jgi:hypothetical protein